MGDRERGVEALRRYFGKTELPSLMSFDDFVAHYDETVGRGKAVEQLGQTIRISELSDAQVDAAWAPALATNGTSYPRIQDLEGLLYDPARAVHFDEVIRKTVADVKDTAVVAASAYAGWQIAAIVVPIVVPLVIEYFKNRKRGHA